MKPKSILPIAVSAITLFATPFAFAEEHDHKGHDHKEHTEHKDHDDHEGHDHGKLAGPNGGRILTDTEPHLEFFVTKDRKVKITVVDDHGKALPLGKQSVDVIAGDRKNPIVMKFTKEGDSLVSDKAFPEGNDFPVVVSIKTTPDAKKVRSKFNLNLADCPSCDYLEYACTCAHGEEEGEDGHEGHDH
ncbi:hypothetical protein [Roseibacillus persicicus]|uniref:hypothetical protein n=1 Tax=Roseibacillus persicicus TaxID=454148 RepID=UPI00280DEAEA|nr:hypothetical protein [Roseibacillus persicicus]MDQ8190232.1 hypothetical protein [Roseibacillus persicicus]